VSASQGYQGPGPSGAVIYDSFGAACNAVRTYPYGVLPKGSCVDGPERTPWGNAQPAGVCYYNNSGTNCVGITSNEPLMVYKCPSGYTANGATCTNNTTVYTCPSGGTLSGTTCTTSATCPTGYTLSQGYCTVIDPWSVKWPADSIPTYVPTADGTGLMPDPRDPDPIPATPTPSEIQNPSQNYQQDPYGNPTSTTITPQPGGGYKVDQRVQTTVNNQTSTTINNITINNYGIVTDLGSRTVQGPIGTATPTGTVSNNIEFPTDYNKEATQQAVKSKLDEIQAGTGAETHPNFSQELEQKKMDMNQPIKDKLDAVPGEYAADKGNWFSWVWTPPVGSCSPWTSTIHGQDVLWDICPYVAKVRDVIGFLLAIFGGWVVYNQMFKREES